MAQVAQKQRQTMKERSLDKVESKRFVKRILAVGISNILYLRNIFPENAFSNKKYDDIPVKILKEKEHEGASRIIHWVKGVYDALDKEYLRALVFAIVSDIDNPKSVIESYTFCFTYEHGLVQTSMSFGENVAKTSIPSEVETQESTKKFLRNLVLLTTNMEDLPSNVFMTVRLLYYDKVTPPEYQPPGFMEAVENDTLSFMVDNIRIKVGHVQTPYTSMKVRVRASKDQFEAKAAAQPDIVVDDTETTFTEEKSPVKQPRSVSKTENYENDEVEVDENKQVALIEPVSEDNDKGKGVRCPCMDPDDDGLMILCLKCNYWQHAICFCLYDESCMPETHICHLCSDKHTNICTDPRLTGLPKEQQQEMCAWRRTMHFCLDKNQISVSMISNNLSSTKAFAQKLLGKLVDEGVVLQGKPNRKTKKINKDLLKTEYERSIVHVCHNLQLQRLDGSNSTNLDNDDTLSMDYRNCDNDVDQAKNSRPLRRRSSMENSQSSALAFRDDQIDEERYRKKRKLSKSISSNAANRKLKSE